jgi:hypothetical protein
MMVISLEKLLFDLDYILNENRRLKEENEYLRGYEKKYHDLLNDSIKHSGEMMGNVLHVLLNKEKYTG